MKKTSEMTNNQVISWLNETFQSVNTYMENGGSLHTDRGYKLADRYSELMDEAKIRNLDVGTLWRSYCDIESLDYYHDQYDIFFLKGY